MTDAESVKNALRVIADENRAANKILHGHLENIANILGGMASGLDSVTGRLDRVEHETKYLKQLTEQAAS